MQICDKRLILKRAPKLSCRLDYISKFIFLLWLTLGVQFYSTQASAFNSNSCKLSLDHLSFSHDEIKKKSDSNVNGPFVDHFNFKGIGKSKFDEVHKPTTTIGQEARFSHKTWDLSE
jgi:hypothetical protein